MAKDKAGSKIGPRPIVLSIPSATEKRFRKLVKTDKQIDLTAVNHELIVARDLKKGSLRSLAAYIVANEGIPDPSVALALVKLLAGSADQTPFRLAIIRHPDLAPNEKPKVEAVTKIKPPSALDYEIAAFCKEHSLDEKQKMWVIEDAHKKFSVSKYAVREARRRVDAEEEEKAKRAKSARNGELIWGEAVGEGVLERRKQALANLADPKPKP